MKEAVIVSAVRTPVGRAQRGTLVNYRPDDMAAVVIGEVLSRAEGVEPPDAIGDPAEVALRWPCAASMDPRPSGEIAGHKLPRPSVYLGRMNESEAIR